MKGNTKTGAYMRCSSFDAVIFYKKVCNCLSCSYPCLSNKDGLRLRLNRAGRILERPNIRSVKQPTKKEALRHCVYTGPVSQVHDMRRVRIVPNLL